MVSLRRVALLLEVYLALTLTGYALGVSAAQYLDYVTSGALRHIGGWYYGVSGAVFYCLMFVGIAFVLLGGPHLFRNIDYLSLLQWLREDEAQRLAYKEENPSTRRFAISFLGSGLTLILLAFSSVL